MAEIVLLVPVPELKELSRDPSLLSRAIRFWDMPLYVVKLPTIIIFPSCCTVKAETPVAPVPGMKDPSREPLGVSLAMLFLLVPL